MLTLSRGAMVRKKRSRDQYCWGVHASTLHARSALPASRLGTSLLSGWAPLLRAAAAQAPLLALQPAAATWLSLSAPALALLLI